MPPPKLRQIILRFSDMPHPSGDGTIDTIAEHRLTAQGNLPDQHVWWGWWTKGSEEDKVAALAAFHEHLKLVGPVNIGLLDRVLEPDDSHSRLFTARCHEVSWSPAGQQDGSPNSE